MNGNYPIRSVGVICVSQIFGYFVNFIKKNSLKMIWHEWGVLYIQRPNSSPQSVVWFQWTYFEPKLRHFRWPGINLLALLRRIDPLGMFGNADAGVADLAGDKFNDAMADGSIWWWIVAAAAGTTDSLELLPDEELGGGFGGSRMRDFLGKGKKRKGYFSLERDVVNLYLNSLVLIVFENIL